MRDGEKIMRCTYCRAMVLPVDIESGGCPDCGGGRYQIAHKITDEEHADAVQRGYVFSEEDWSTTPWRQAQ